MNNKLFVGNLSYTINKDDVRQLFAAHGKVVKAEVMIDKETGKSRGFGFVEMENEAAATAAIAALHNQVIDKRPLVVNVAKPMSKPAFAKRS